MNSPRGAEGSVAVFHVLLNAIVLAVAFICFALHCDQMYVDLPFGRIWVYTAKRLEHLRAEGSEIISELE